MIFHITYVSLHIVLYPIVKMAPEFTQFLIPV